MIMFLQVEYERLTALLFPTGWAYSLEILATQLMGQADLLPLPKCGYIIRFAYSYVHDFFTI